MEDLRYLVVEIESDQIVGFTVVGRYSNPKDAFDCRDAFKKENPTCSYRVAVFCED